MNRLILWIFCLFWCCSQLLGQSIEGKVFDDNSGEPLLGANVVLLSDYRSGAATDGRGRFALPLSTTPDTLLVSYLGYQMAKVPLDAEAIPEELAIGLKPLATQGPTVTVKGREAVHSIFAVQKIERMDIYRNPSAQADPLLAVDMQSSSTTLGETANISLRGSRPEATGIFLNGIPLRDAVRIDQDNGVGQFSIFNTELLDEVEVYPSNAPLALGQTTGGGIALETVDEIPLSGYAVNLHLAGAGLQGVHQFHDDHRVLGFVNLGHHFLFKQLNPEALARINGFESIEGGIFSTHELSDRLQARFYNYTLGERYRYDYRSAAYNGLFEQQKLRNLSLLNLIYSGPRYRLHFDQKWNWSQAQYRLGNLDLKQGVGDYFGQFRGVYWADQISVEAGVSVERFDRITSGQVPELDFATSPEHPVISVDFNIRFINIEAFAYGKWAIDDHWTAGAGARYLLPHAGQSGRCAGQIHLTHQQGAHQWRFGAGHYYQFLPARSGESNVLDRRAQQLSIDYQWEWSDRTRLGAGFYHHRAQEQYRTRVSGLEIWGNWQGEQWKLQWSASGLRAFDNSTGTYRPADKDIHYFMRVLGGWTPLPGLEFTLAYRMRQGAFYRPVIGGLPAEEEEFYLPVYADQEMRRRYPDYHRVDIGASYLFPLAGNPMIAFANVANVADTGNVQSFRYDEQYQTAIPEFYARRTLFLGVVWLFQ